MSEGIGEKCAVVAVVGPEGSTVAPLVHDSLFALQHRGVEASGIVSSNTENDGFSGHRKPGLVRDVYDESVVNRLAGNVAIGHNKYSTNGAKDAHLQPFVDKRTQFAFAHNGNLPVTTELEQYLEASNIRTSQFNDSEMAGLAVAKSIGRGLSLPDAVKDNYERFQGAFSCVAMHDGMVVAFRDPVGIRPLALGTIGETTVVASETCGLDIIEASYNREILPGEMVVITPDGTKSEQIASGQPKLDIFEFVYFARHDSQLYGQRVNEVRRRFGEQLAHEHHQNGSSIVVPIPDTSVPAAEGYAKALGLESRTAVIKNRYIGRTFMQPTDASRKLQLRRKHTIIPEAVDGQDIILIDDSIVRLNTMPRLVALAKECGARSVKVLIASPPVRFPDFYGIDTPAQSELAAFGMTIEQMRQKIGCEYLGFLSLEGMIKATNIPGDQFNLSCFTGEYPIDIGEHAKDIKAPVSMQYVA